MPLSCKLYALWQARADCLAPGDETGLVDAFADLLGLRDWYVWQPDPGPAASAIAAVADHQGVDNPALLAEKYPAAVMHMLSALQRFDNIPVDQVRDIAFEIGRLGERGLDYSDPTPKYTLQTLPGETFTGLQLMCLMYVGFQRFAPELDTGMELHDSFLTALALFQGE